MGEKNGVNANGVVDVPSSSRWIHLTGCLHSGVYGKLTNQRACKSGGGEKRRRRRTLSEAGQRHRRVASSRSFDRLRPVALSTFIEKGKKKKGKRKSCLRSYPISFSLPFSLSSLSLSLSPFSNRILFFF